MPTTLAPPSSRPANDLLPQVSPHDPPPGEPPSLQREDAAGGPPVAALDPAGEQLLPIGAQLFTANPFRLEPGGLPAEPEIRRRVTAFMATVVDAVRDLLAAGEATTGEQLVAYRDVALHVLWEGFADELRDAARTGAVRKGVFKTFSERYERLFRFKGSTIEVYAAGHAFALAYKARRAYDGIVETILGCSPPTAGLQADVWDEVWEGDVHGFATWGYARAEPPATLIVGPTGSGKEGVARVLGRSRYIPYDEAKDAFASRPDDGVQVVNVAGLLPELADSLLFGHVRGAFTGAVEKRNGALFRCKDGGVLFLDEIGDLPPVVQVKLLRVLQEREFTVLGDTEPVPFGGTILAATQPAILREGKLRDDVYYRVCERLLQVPSLRARIAADPRELLVLIAAFALTMAGPARAPALVAKVLAVLDTPELRDYPWPGNVRELQGCVANVHAHGVYVPRSRIGEEPAASRGFLTMEEVKRRHALDVLETTGDLMEAARLLDVDHKTLRRLLDLPADVPAAGVGTKRAG